MTTEMKRTSLVIQNHRFSVFSVIPDIGRFDPRGPPPFRSGGALTSSDSQLSSRSSLRSTSTHRPAHVRQPSRRHWRLLRTGGGAVMLLCLAGAVWLSTLLYQRDFLREDFAGLQPGLEPHRPGTPEPVRDDFQGRLSVLQERLRADHVATAIIHLVFPHPIILLWLQDLAVVGTGSPSICGSSTTSRRARSHGGRHSESRSSS